MIYLHGVLRHHRFRDEVVAGHATIAEKGHEIAYVKKEMKHRQCFRKGTNYTTSEAAR